MPSHSGLPARWTPRASTTRATCARRRAPPPAAAASHRRRPLCTRSHLLPPPPHTRAQEYDSPAQFWAAVAARRAADAAAAAEGADCAPGGDAAAPAWYSGAVSHWDAQTPDDSGVLGGHTAVAPQDVRDSATFLRRALGAEALAEAAAGRRRLAALDAGAGVGRVAEALLLQHCAVVDLVEPSAHLLAAAERRLAAPPAGRWPEGHVAERFTCVGLEGCAPEAGRYDVVWVQWALMYLTDGARRGKVPGCFALKLLLNC